MELTHHNIRTPHAIVDPLEGAPIQCIPITRLSSGTGRSPENLVGTPVRPSQTVVVPKHAWPWLTGGSRRSAYYPSHPVPPSRLDTAGRWLTLPTMADKTATIPIDPQHLQEEVVSCTVEGFGREQQVTGPQSLVDTYKSLWHRAVKYGHVDPSNLILDPFAGTFLFLSDRDMRIRCQHNGTTPSRKIVIVDEAGTDLS